MLSGLPPPEKLNVITFFRDFRDYFCFNIFLPILGKNKRMGDDFRRKAAFTLAEVLITLGVIGIVAAMTMPVLTANYQKTVLKNQFKKAYSTYQQALLKTSFDNGGDISCYYNADNSGDKVLTNCRSFYEAFTKELKVTKICENNTECNTNYSGITFNGGCSTSLSLQSKQYVLADGTIIFPYTDGINYPLFFVDINGLKGPNKPGYDLFSFMIMRKENSDAYFFSSTITGCLYDSIDENGFKSLTDIYK